jgi:hypothetical protein
VSARAWWPIGQVAILALWLGAAGFFAAAVAPALFDSLPSRALAGVVVGRLLPVIFYAGMLIGVLVVCLEWAGAGAAISRGATIAGGAMAAACAVAQFVVAPRIERVRGEIAGPIDALPMDDLRRIAFGRLHAVSVAWLGVAIVAAVVALVLDARKIHPA